MINRRRDHTRVPRAAALATAGFTRSEIAQRLGLPVRYVSAILSLARKRGLLDPELMLQRRPGNDAAPDIEEDDGATRCPRCYLRGEHVCLPGAAWYGSQRSEVA